MMKGVSNTNNNNTRLAVLVAGALLLGFFLGRSISQQQEIEDASPWQSTMPISCARMSYVGPRVAPAAVESCPKDDIYLQTHAADLHGQLAQDRFVYQQFFRGVCSRVYVEIGAYDGSLNSNTWFFHHHMGWRGILVEASPSSFEKARHNRPNDALYHRAITSDSEDGYISFMFTDKTPQFNSIAGFEDKRRMKSAHEIKVPTGTFHEIFAEQGVTRVDFFSLDVEGGELVVLETIDFDAVLICVLMIENNPGDTVKNLEVDNFMKRHKFSPQPLGHQDTVWVNPRCPEYHR
jgi:FkbM family methyltransferase